MKFHLTKYQFGSMKSIWNLKRTNTTWWKWSCSFDVDPYEWDYEIHCIFRYDWFQGLTYEKCATKIRPRKVISSLIRLWSCVLALCYAGVRVLLSLLHDGNTWPSSLLYPHDVKKWLSICWFSPFSIKLFQWQSFLVF